MGNRTAKTEEYFMKQDEFEYCYSLVRKINHSEKDMLEEIDEKLTKEEQEYFVKNNRLARLQSSFDFEKEYEGATDINGYPVDRIIISKSKKDSDDIDDYLKSCATYTGYESFLIFNGYNILHAHRDARGDWGDDAGYMIIISEKDGKFHVHTPFINYNCDIQYIKIEEDMLSFDTKDKAVKFIHDLAIDMNNLMINGDEDLFAYDDDYEDVIEYKDRYPTILKNKETFDVVSQIFWSSAFFEESFETLIAMKHIELLNGYYDDYKKVGDLNDFRLNGENRFDSYDFDVIIEIVD